MQNYNFGSNRRKFNVSGTTSNTDITQNNPTASECFDSENSLQYFTQNPKTNLKNGKSYSYMKIKTSPANENKNHTAHEKFLQVILISAMSVAVICMCLSIASMFMFFGI